MGQCVSCEEGAGACASDTGAASRVKLRAIAPGQPQGVLLVAEGFLDDFEGVAVRRGAGGATIVYILSDDNFNPLQSNLLLLFVLLP